MLACELKPALAEAGFLVDSVDLPECDITRPQDVVSAYEKTRPEVVFNCAAYTKVDLAEGEAAAAFAVNADGAGNLARALPKGAALVQLSTDYVFDGSEAGAVRRDRPGPACSPAGRSTREEQAARAKSRCWPRVPPRGSCARGELYWPPAG